ncbi:hypothetical protein [Neisseria sp. Ec49-e6-T10]|uniref:hypothetical protein n=1 Tax=Neisseria sp. Ec49-e6-T10 TaxID=3140744 RepID=UPI003EBEBB60
MYIILLVLTFLFFMLVLIIFKDKDKKIINRRLKNASSNEQLGFERSFYAILLGFFNNDRSKADPYLENEYLMNSNLSCDDEAALSALKRLGLIKMKGDEVFWTGTYKDFVSTNENIRKEEII